MINKEEIIIDGVDVSECKYLNKVVNEEPYCNIDEEHIYTCSSDKNCDYKQLARKTQECEEYKKRAVYFKDVNKQLGYKYLTIKQECEELKEENQKLEMQLCNNCGERDDYNIPCKMIRDLDYGLQKEIEENDRYHKALEEIEKICLEDTYTFADGTQVRYDSLDDILDIINKAKREQ